MPMSRLEMSMISVPYLDRLDHQIAPHSRMPEHEVDCIYLAKRS